MITKGQATPWGAAQTVDAIAPGILHITTASHGGIWLAPEQFDKMPADYPKTFAGAPWYEEDCDWAKVAVTFPEHFTPKTVEAAKKSLQWETENADW